jgi:rubrerythrin
MFRKLLSYLRGVIKLRGGGPPEDPTETHQYGELVSYTPCPECGEGTLQYDAAAEAMQCPVCGAVDEHR